MSKLPPHIVLGRTRILQYVALGLIPPFILGQYVMVTAGPYTEQTGENILLHIAIGIGLLFGVAILRGKYWARNTWGFTGVFISLFLCFIGISVWSNALEMILCVLTSGCTLLATYQILANRHISAYYQYLNTNGVADLIDEIGK